MAWSLILIRMPSCHCSVDEKLIEGKGRSRRPVWKLLLCPKENNKEVAHA